MSQRFTVPGGVEVTVAPGAPAVVHVGDTTTPITPRAVPGPRGALAVELDGRRVLVWTAVTTQGTVTTRHVAVDGRTTLFTEASKARRAGASDETDLTAPMPGTVLDVRVAPGDAVAKGAVLVVIEAMKMEHSVAAPRDAVVKAVHVARGDRTTPGQALVDLS